MTRADPSTIPGGKSRVSEHVNGMRELSLGESVALRDALGIPTNPLIGSESEHA